MHVGQSLITPPVTIRQLFVIQPQLMQQSGMEIMNGQRLLNSVRTKLIRRAERHSRAKSPPGQKD